MFCITKYGFHVHSGIGAHGKMEQDNESKKSLESEEEINMTTKRKTRQKKGSYERSWEPIPGNIEIKIPRSSPTFTMKDLDKVFDDLYRKKKRTR